MEYWKFCFRLHEPFEHVASSWIFVEILFGIVGILAVVFCAAVACGIQ